MRPVERCTYEVTGFASLHLNQNDNEIMHDIHESPHKAELV